MRRFMLHRGAFLGNDDGVSQTHYDALGIPVDASFEVVRRAYRARMRQLHPDSSGVEDLDTHGIARLTSAWSVLRDPGRRRDYDDTLLTATATGSREPGPGRFVQPPPAPQAARSRREAWVLGVRAQIVHLSSRAGRSATQTLLLRNARAGRAEYDELVDELVQRIAMDTEARVRAARAAGAAPLDLGVGATLLGVRSVADQLRRSAAGHPTVIDVMEAELLDRMWDVLAHELPISLTSALGGNPGITRLLRAAG